MQIMDQTDIPYSNPQRILRSGGSKYLYVVYSGSEDEEARDAAVVKYKLKTDGEVSSANSSRE